MYTGQLTEERPGMRSDFVKQFYRTVLWGIRPGCVRGKTGTAVSADPLREQAYDIQLGTEGCPVLWSGWKSDRSEDACLSVDHMQNIKASVDKLAGAFCR